MGHLYVWMYTTQINDQERFGKNYYLLHTPYERLNKSNLVCGLQLGVRVNSLGPDVSHYICLNSVKASQYDYSCQLQ